MPQSITSYSVEERILDGGAAWVAIRARGAEWSWLTPAEAADSASNGSRDTGLGIAGRLQPITNAGCLPAPTDFQAAVFRRRCRRGSRQKFSHLTPAPPDYLRQVMTQGCSTLNT